MEDQDDILREFGIGKGGVWVEGKVLRDGSVCKMPPPIDVKDDKCNPQKDAYDPHYVAGVLVQHLDVQDFETALISMTSSLNESKAERDRLVRNNFSTYVRCRALLEQAGTLRDRLSLSALSHRTSIYKESAARILLPSIELRTSLAQREQRREFISRHRILFEGPEILEEYLDSMDYRRFVEDYQEVLKIKNAYSDSKYVKFLHSRFLRVVARFRNAVMEGVEKSRTTSECLGWLTLYLAVDPSDSKKLFGTILTVTKKEFNAQLESFKAAQFMDPTAPFPSQEESERRHSALLCFLGELTSNFLFMGEAMGKIQYLHTQESGMEEFIDNSFGSFVHTLIEAINSIYGQYEESESCLWYDLSICSTIGSLCRSIQRTIKKLQDHGICLSPALALSKLFRRLVALLWSRSLDLLLLDLISLQEEFTLCDLALRTASIRGDLRLEEKKEDGSEHTGAQAEIARGVKKLLKKGIAYVSGQEEKAHALVVAYFIEQEVRKAGKGTELGSEGVEELMQDLKLARAKIRGEISKQLSRNLEQSLTREEFLMGVLKTKTKLTVAKLVSAQPHIEVIKLSLASLQLDFVQQYYLANYLPKQKEKEAGAREEQKEELDKLRKQFGSLCL